MITRDKNQDSLRETDYQDKNKWPQGEEADAMMECLMGNYLMQNEIMRAKLYYAQQATKKSLAELEMLTGDTKQDASVKQLQKIKELDGLWKQLISLLSQLGLAEEDIANIEEAVTSTPKVVRQYYDVLLEQDRNLSNLIYEMESDVFADAHRQAKEVTDKIQTQPNPLTGLTRDDYEPAPENITKSSGFEIITLPNFRENR